MFLGGGGGKGCELRLEVGFYCIYMGASSRDRLPPPSPSPSPWRLLMTLQSASDTRDVVALATQAVKLDVEGNYESAMHAYAAAAAACLSCCYASGEPEVRRVYEAKAAEYTSRAETLQRFVHARSGPSSVEPPVAAAGGSGVGAPVPPVRRPTSASHSGGASGVEGGCAAPAGASASQLLHAGVQAGVAVAAATAAAATSLNAKYDITGKVSTGIHRLVDTAKDINEKHKVVDKVSTIASAAVVKTQELDAKYGVTATVTGALLGALTRVSEASTEVLRRHEAATSEGAGAHAAPAIAGRK